jgi:hypothetical protein
MNLHFGGIEINYSLGKAKKVVELVKDYVERDKIGWKVFEK